MPGPNTAGDHLQAEDRPLPSAVTPLQAEDRPLPSAVTPLQAKLVAS